MCVVHVLSMPVRLQGGALQSKGPSKGKANENAKANANANAKAQAKAKPKKVLIPAPMTAVPVIAKQSAVPQRMVVATLLIMPSVTPPMAPPQPLAPSAAVASVAVPAAT